MHSNIVEKKIFLSRGFEWVQGMKKLNQLTNFNNFLSKGFLITFFIAKIIKNKFWTFKNNFKNFTKISRGGKILKIIFNNFSQFFLFLGKHQKIIPRQEKYEKLCMYKIFKKFSTIGSISKIFFT